MEQLRTSDVRSPSGVIAIIPARLASTRLPRKVLLSETGKTLIEHVWQQVARARSLGRVIVAADDDEIASVVRSFGGECELTGEHASGTDRIAEVVRRLGLSSGIVVNIQGDEPELDPANIDAVVAALEACPSAQMATLVTPFHSYEDVQKPSCVKAVVAQDGRALYFSRSIVPHLRDRDPAGAISEMPWHLHIGIYAYRAEFLLELTKMPVSRLESYEKLEQLRALELGARIQVAIVEHNSFGIDTPADYAAFVQRWKNRMSGG